MDTQLITQSTLDEVGLHLDNLDSDLRLHADGSLSLAHGINAILFPGPTVDAYGNNVRYYNNSAGHLIGEYQLRFSVDNKVYYAPARLTNLAAQPSTATSLSAAETRDLLTGRGSTALATQFREEAVSDLQSVKTDVLLPHTHLGHWEAHAPVRVLPRITYDSDGHVVGRYTLVWQFKGAKFEIPCDPNLGGPPEPPRLATLTPTSANVRLEEGEGYDQKTKVSFRCTAEGYRPFSFKWEMKTVSSHITGDAWARLTADDGTSLGFVNSYDGRLSISARSADDPGKPGENVLVIDSLNTEEGKNEGMIRCTVSNSVGSTTVVAPIYATDKTQHGICAMFTASCEANYCDVSYLTEAIRFQIGVHQERVFVKEARGGYLVLGGWLGTLIQHRHWYSWALFRFLVKPMHRDMTRANRHERPLGSGLVLGFMRLACLLTYVLCRKQAQAALDATADLSLMELYKRKLRQLRRQAARRTP